MCDELKEWQERQKEFKPIKPIVVKVDLLNETLVIEKIVSVKEGLYDDAYRKPCIILEKRLYNSEHKMLAKNPVSMYKLQIFMGLEIGWFSEEEVDFEYTGFPKPF